MSLRTLSASVVLVVSSAAAFAQTPSEKFTQLSGAEAVDASGAAIGRLHDVVVSGEGRVTGLLIGEGGLFGIGQTLKAVSMDRLPVVNDGKVVLDGQTKESLAALPVYQEEKPAEPAASPTPPVSGASQAAPQKASVDVPVAPAEVPAKTDENLPPTPENDTATGKASADSSRAPGVSPTLGEEADQGSGSDGMAPQQGTGTGATQANAGANEGGRSDDGNASGAVPELNQQFARDKQPENQPMPEASAGRAAVNAQPSDASAAAQPSREDIAVPEASDKVWRIGKIVGANVVGDRDGMSVKDVHFADGRVQEVILSQSGQPDRSIPFSGLNLGGTADAPKVALTSLAAPEGGSAPLP